MTLVEERLDRPVVRLVISLTSEFGGLLPQKGDISGRISQVFVPVPLSPVAHCLLRRLRNVVDQPGEELEHIPSGLAAVDSPAS